MMKFTILILIFLSLYLPGKAQTDTVPNGGFENWSSYTGNSGLGSFVYDMPDQWKTTDSISLALTGLFSQSAVEETADVHSGTSALKLIGWNAFGTNAPGAATNGDIDGVNLTIIKGTPDTNRHAKLTGFYKYSPQSGDTASIQVVLFKWNTITLVRDTIAYGIFEASVAVAAYTAFECNLNYLDTVNKPAPDTMLMLIATSPVKLGSGHPGTILMVDDLSFIGTVGINEVEEAGIDVNLFPNPAANELVVRAELLRPTRLTYTIYDLKGTLMVSGKMDGSEANINVRNFSNGVYYIYLSDDQQKKLFSSDFTVLH